MGKYTKHISRRFILRLPFFVCPGFRVREVTLWLIWWLSSHCVCNMNRLSNIPFNITDFFFCNMAACFGPLFEPSSGCGIKTLSQKKYRFLCARVPCDGPNRRPKHNAAVLCKKQIVVSKGRYVAASKRFTEASGHRHSIAFAVILWVSSL